MAVIEHPFEGMSHNFVPGGGPSPCRLMFVGDKPGFHEDEHRPPRAFVGNTGKELDRFYLPLAMLRRREVYVTNIVKCFPLGDRQPTADEIRFFEPYLLAEIEEINPEFIVPLGATAVKWFLGGHTDLGMVHGLPHVSKKFPGRIIIPSYHVAAGLHNIENTPLIVYDFQQVRFALEGTLPPRVVDIHTEPIYIECKNALDVEMSLDGCSSILMGQDTEGYAGNPWGLSYSTHEGIAYVIRKSATQAIRAFSEWIQRHPEVVTVLHNALHDLPILREMGVPLINFEDTMVYSYCLCVEPQGLKDLAYRHAGMKMKAYMDVVGPAVRKMTTEYLIKVASTDWGLDPPVPLCESGEEEKWRQPQALHKRACKAVNDIFGVHTGTIIGDKRGGSAKLKELGVRVGKVDAETVARLDLPKTLNAWYADVPIPIVPKLDEHYGEFIYFLEDPVPPPEDEQADPVKRWKDMSEELEESVARAEAVIGVLPETGLDALEDQDVAIKYSARDADSTLRVRDSLVKQIKANGLSRLAALDMSVLPYVDRMRTIGVKVDKEHMFAYGHVLKDEMHDIQVKLKKDLGVWINPSSPPQVAKVIYEQLGFPVEVRTETGQPSTADKVLEALSTQHPSIADITDYRELHKLRSTYALKLPRWMDANGRCHPTWKVTRVASGRVSTADPNLLAIPTRSDRGKMIRAGFLPEPGHSYVGVDLSQIEMRVLAHYSKDPNLIKIFNTGLDFHEATAAFMWRVDPEVIKADHKLNGATSMRSSGKNVSFGIVYGIGPKGLRAQMRSKTKIDWSEEQCQEMIDKWLKEAYQYVSYYMEKQKHFARQNGFVSSMYGRRRYVPGVNSSIPRIREEAYRQAINHPIQATAAEILKVAEANIWKNGLPMMWDAGYYCEPVLAIHDELIFEVDNCIANDWLGMVKYEMENAVELCVPVLAEGHISTVSWEGLK